MALSFLLRCSIYEGSLIRVDVLNALCLVDYQQIQDSWAGSNIEDVRGKMGLKWNESSRSSVSFSRCSVSFASSDQASYLSETLTIAREAIISIAISILSTVILEVLFQIQLLIQNEALKESSMSILVDDTIRTQNIFLWLEAKIGDRVSSFNDINRNEWYNNAQKKCHIKYRYTWKSMDMYA